MHDCELRVDRYQDEHSGEIKTIWRNSEWKLFRMNGPALICEYPTGEMSECWYKIPGLYHREDGPAVIHYNLSKQVASESWFINGYKFNPNGGPSHIYYRDKDEKSCLNMEKT